MTFVEKLEQQMQLMIGQNPEIYSNDHPLIKKMMSEIEQHRIRKGVIMNASENTAEKSRLELTIEHLTDANSSTVLDKKMSDFRDKLNGIKNKRAEKSKMITSIKLQLDAGDITPAQFDSYVLQLNSL